MSLDPGPLPSGFFILNSKFFILHSKLRPVYTARPRRLEAKLRQSGTGSRALSSKARASLTRCFTQHQMGNQDPLKRAMIPDLASHSPLSFHKIRSCCLRIFLKFNRLGDNSLNSSILAHILPLQQNVGYIHPHFVLLIEGGEGGGPLPSWSALFPEEGQCEAAPSYRLFGTI